jgi:hypothetical protein
MVHDVPELVEQDDDLVMPQQRRPAVMRSA